MPSNRKESLLPEMWAARPVEAQTGSTVAPVAAGRGATTRRLLHLSGLAVLCAFAVPVVHAQTVTVGTASSTTSGNVTTVMVPIALALPPAPAPTVAASLATFSAQTGLSDGSATGQLLLPAVKPVALTTVVTDTASAWNATTSTYTIPTTASYLLVSTLRLADGSTTAIGFGQGVSTGPSDNPNYLWSTTVGLRNMLLNTRVVVLAAGTQISLFASSDAGAGLKLGSASLSIQQLQ